MSTEEALMLGVLLGTIVGAYGPLLGARALVRILRWWLKRHGYDPDDNDSDSQH